MTEDMKIINFDSFMPKDTKILAYKSNGELIRKSLKLNEYDKDDSIRFTVLIPNRFYSLNTSFFLGCFGPSVITLGEDAFKKKYIFKCEPFLLNSVYDGIKRSLRYTVGELNG